jgi:very-short-patch-repair endonuclease
MIANLARAQHGVVGRRQLLAAGIGRRAIETRLARGSLHLVYRGVYAVGHSVLGALGHRMAAVLACGPDAVLSHRSAAVHLGIRPYRGVLEVTRPTEGRDRPSIKVHCSSLPEDEVTVIEGIPVTGLSRTLLDLAALVDRRQVERTMTEAHVRGLTDRVALPALLRRYPNRKGTATLRAILGEEGSLLGRLESELEERFAALLERAGLPRPRFNADLAVGGRFLRPDALWEEARLIVELDGRQAHGTAQAFEADRARDRLLLLHGWRTMRVTWRQLRDAPEKVIADLELLLEVGERRRATAGERARDGPGPGSR